MEIAIQDSPITKTNFNFGMDFIDEFWGRGYHCILEIEGRSEESVGIQFDNVVTELGLTRSVIRLSTLQDANGPISYYKGNAKITISNTDTFNLPVSFSSVDLQNFQIAVHGIGSIYPSQSTITFKVTTFSVQQFISYSWKIFKVKNNEISNVIQEDITFKKVYTIPPNKLSEGMYLLVVTVSTIKGTSSANGTFSVSSVSIPAIVMDVLPFESNVPVQDLTLGATILSRGLTNLSTLEFN